MTKRELPIEIPYDSIIEFCKKWQIIEFALFGSVLRDDFGPDSDIDVLVKFSEKAQTTLFDMVDMKNELETIFGRTVDLLSRRGVESSRNPIRKNAILNSAELLYAA